MTRLYLTLLAPLILLDCAGNCLLAFGSFDNTLSATAWTVRNHGYFGWTHRFIDVIFGAGHCEAQAQREQQYGSVWAALAAQWKERP